MGVIWTLPDEEVQPLSPTSSSMRRTAGRRGRSMHGRFRGWGPSAVEPRPRRSRPSWSAGSSGHRSGWRPCTSSRWRPSPRSARPRHGECIEGSATSGSRGVRSAARAHLAARSAATREDTAMSEEARRIAAAEELIRRFSAGVKAVQLYAADHPIVDAGDGSADGAPRPGPDRGGRRRGGPDRPAGRG